MLETENCFVKHEGGPNVTMRNSNLLDVMSTSRKEKAQDNLDRNS